MFRNFPTSYVWDMSVNLSVEMGCQLGEIDAMRAPLKHAAFNLEDGGTFALAN
ncbi:MAG: hypothetical protein LAT78_14835 [Roseinatronobacter sp.]|nr:hypothetical protein [Roseinatronobacter sp.]